MATMVSFNRKPIRINSRRNGIEFSYDGGRNWSTLVINQNASGDLTDIQINGSTITATFETRDYLTTATTQISSGTQRLNASSFKKIAQVAK